MKIWDAYKLAIEMGSEVDPRGKTVISRSLKEEQEAYDELSEKAKGLFDTELLTNPFPDTRLLAGDPEQKVSHIFAGVDIGVSELLLVDRLNQKGAGIDLVMAHHPEGIALTTLHKMMAMQADVFSCCGVPINAAEQIIQAESGNVELSIITGNYNRVADAARLLDLSLLNVHTPADNLVQHYTEQRLAATEPYKIQDIMDMLMEEPEYIEASKYEAGPLLVAGSPSNRVGKVMVDMTGGTDAGPKLYAQLEAAGVGTLVAMHMSNGTKEVLSKAHINIVLAGHMSSDSLGMNLLLDAYESKGVKITTGSGLTRFSRLNQA